MAARIRTIKPELWESPTLAKLPIEARYFFIGLISRADDHGNMKAEPRLLASQIFPFDEWVTADLITGWIKLLEPRHVLTYEVEQALFLHLKGWAKHQRIDKRFPPQVPIPPASIEGMLDLEMPSTVQVPYSYGTGTGRVRAGKEMEEEEDPDTDLEWKSTRGRKRAATSFPSKWIPTPTHTAYCQSNRLDTALEAEAFKARNLARDERYVNWDSAFQHWLTNAVRWGAERSDTKKGVVEQRMDEARRLDAIYAEREQAFEQKELL